MMSLAALIGVYSSTPASYGLYMVTSSLMLGAASILAAVRLMRP